MVWKQRAYLFTVLEITPAGSIRIFTGPRSESNTTATNNNAGAQDETKSIKKQAQV
jgi:hypothetical protein